MRKICFSLLCGVFFVVSIALGAIVAQATTAKSVTGFWLSSFVWGIAFDGTCMLADEGYAYAFKSDASTAELYASLQNDEVVFIHTHGAPGYFRLSPSNIVSGNMINSFAGSSETRLVYISACNSGLSSSTYGNVGSALCNEGVETVVAFEDELTAGTEDDGIHKFNQLVVENLIDGYTINWALISAKKQIYAESGKYWGCDSYVIYGNKAMKLD